VNFAINLNCLHHVAFHNLFDHTGIVAWGGFRFESNAEMIVQEAQFAFELHHTRLQFLEILICDYNIVLISQFQLSFFLTLVTLSTIVCERSVRVPSLISV